MNRAQRLLQPMIDDAQEKYKKASYGSREESKAGAVVNALVCATGHLAPLTNAFDLADVPTAKWEAGEKKGSYHCEGWNIWPHEDGHGQYRITSHRIFSVVSSLHEGKRLAEINLYLDKIRLALVEELSRLPEMKSE